MKIKEHKITLLDGSYELEALETRVKSVSNFLGDHSLSDIIAKPNTALFLVDNIGIVGAINILHGQFGEAHITFWDKKLTKARIEVCRELAELIIACAGLQFLLTAMPVELKGLIKFAERVGFVPVQRSNGILLMAMLRKGQL